MSESDKRAKDLASVLEISRSMAATVDLDSLLALIIDRAMELLDAERASLFLFDRGTNELYSRVAAGTKEIRFPADRGIAGAAVKNGQTLNVPDAYADERFNPEIDRTTGFRTRNILTIPLRDYEGALVGVLQVLNKRGGGFQAYDIELAETLAAQAGVVLQRATLISHYLEKKNMERAMELAREIQQALFPQSSPAVCGFDIAGCCRPADATGGDAYDFMPLPGGRWMIVVADATGHGVGPAMVIAETRAMLRAVSLHDSNVPKILATVNNLLSQDLSDSRFVTCFFGMLDPLARRLAFASAGHGPILFYRRGTDSFQQLSATGIPLGIMGEMDYEAVETWEMEAGDIAIITTDGYFEAVNADSEAFGVDRMLELIRRDRDRPAAEIIANLTEAVTGFARGMPQADDLTAVVIRRR